ncbi:ATP-binding protein, partial [Paraburkholderia sp. NMBU_R16]|nr:ATP-binding protein [Paraburkholderia sp. NMBU_R16]
FCRNQPYLSLSIQSASRVRCAGLTPALDPLTSPTRNSKEALLLTANQPFGEWDKVFPDRAMTVAAVDRLVHHSTIFEMNVE